MHSKPYIKHLILQDNVSNLRLKIRNYRILCCVLLLLNILVFFYK